MRLKNKKHTHFSRTDNKKYQEQNHKKEKTNNNNTIIVIIIFYRIRVHYTVLTQHTTPHTTPKQMQPKHMGCNQQDIISLGVIYRTTLVLL